MKVSHWIGRIWNACQTELRCVRRPFRFLCHSVLFHASISCAWSLHYPLEPTVYQSSRPTQTDLKCTPDWAGLIRTSFRMFSTQFYFVPRFHTDGVYCSLWNPWWMKVSHRLERIWSTRANCARAHAVSIRVVLALSFILYLDFVWLSL